MLSGDSSIARGQDGAFYQMLGRFSEYWQRIDILTPTASDAKSCVIHDNVYVHPAQNHRLFQPFFIKRTAQRLFAERPYHLVTSHDFGFFYNGIGAWWLLRNRDIPLVSEIHHIEGYPIASTTREKIWRWVANQYLPWAAGHVRAFRVVNHIEVPDYLRKIGIPDAQILVLPSLYIDLEHYQPQAIDKRYDVLFVGRFAANKGILRLLDAIKIVRRTYPDLRVGLRGDGELKETIEQFITHNDLTRNVDFIPRVADTAEMVTLYNQARMLVCASTVEGGPRVTVEAMACGVPVISTPVGIMPEIIRNGDNGFIVPHDENVIADRIQHLLDDPANASQIGLNAHITAEQFAADKIIGNYARAYHALIENTQIAL